MSFLEVTAQDYYLKFKNTTGSEIAIGQLVLWNNQFGECIGKVSDDETRPPEPVPNTEYGLLNTAPMRKIQTSQIDGGDTFAIDTKVYMEPGAGNLVDTVTASTFFVGIVTKAKGTDDWIEIKTVQPIEETT